MVTCAQLASETERPTAIFEVQLLVGSSFVGSRGDGAERFRHPIHFVHI
jgi:hypothetical protein